MERTSTWIQTNGIRLHTIIAGPESGKPVILMHGFPEFWYSWDKLIDPLAQAGLRVIVPDLRGYNLSDKPRGVSNYRMDVLAGDMIGLIDALGYKSASLVGHDWGGAIAWVTSVLYPERIERLVALNAPYPPVVFRTLLRYPKQILRSAYIYYFQIPVLTEAVLRNDNWRLLVEGMRNSSRPGTFSEADLERYREAWWRKDAMTSMLNWYRALMSRPFRLPLNPRLKMPVLILWGVNDFALGRELAGASLELCESGELVFFDQASHWLQHEEPREIALQILGFFDFPAL